MKDTGRNSGMRRHRPRAQYRPPLPTWATVGWIFLADGTSERILSNGRHTRTEEFDRSELA